MRTAIDSSVLLAILKEESGHARWQIALQRASTEGVLLISPIAFAEISPGWPSCRTGLQLLDELGMVYDHISPEAAYLAGQTQVRYRREGGPREHLIPDFLIAAHAKVQADRLATVDRGYLRRYFPELRLLSPASG